MAGIMTMKQREQSNLYPHKLKREDEEIRVVTLKPAEEGKPVCGTLEQVRPNDELQYIALSYVWGDLSITKPMILNGQVFEVTTNLELALRQMSLRYVGLKIWIDALCINQGDISERNEQVLRVGQVFRKAEKVIIWLGDADPTTAALINAVTQSPPTLPKQEGEGFYQQLAAYEREVRLQHFLLATVARRPWWARVWTVQECMLSSQDCVFQIGLHAIGWTEFFNFFYGLVERVRSLHIETRLEASEINAHFAISDAEDYLDADMAAISALADLHRHFAKLQRIPLATLASLCFDRHASNPHDYVYGLLGLVFDQERRLINVDYRQSHQETFRSLILIMFSRSEEYVMKMFSFFSFRQDGGGPSWVPDLASQSRFGPNASTLLAMDGAYGSLPEDPFSDDRNVLMLCGVVLGEIVHNHPISNVQDGFVQCIFDLGRLATDQVKALGRHGAENISGQPVCLRRMFTGFIGSRELTFPDRTTLDLWWDALAEHGYPLLEDMRSVNHDQPGVKFDGRAVDNICDRMKTYALLACRGKSLIVTNTGHIGVSIPFAQPGDKVVYFFGFHTPFVIRAADTSYSRLVGAVRIAGLEDGDSMKQFYLRHEQKLSQATYRIG